MLRASTWVWSSQGRKWPYQGFILEELDIHTVAWVARYLNQIFHCASDSFHCAPLMCPFFLRSDSNWDQLFGILGTAMRHCDLIVDEDDLVLNLKCIFEFFQPIFQCTFPSGIFGSYFRKIQHICSRISIREWLGPNATINVCRLTAVRPWKAWFLALTR